MDIFNKKKVRALQYEVDKLKIEKLKMGDLLDQANALARKCDIRIELDKNKIRDLENKLAVATRLNEIYEAKNGKKHTVGKLSVRDSKTGRFVRSDR